MNSLITTEFISLNPKVYSINHQTINEFNEIKVKKKKPLKEVSKVVVKKEISHNDYVKTLQTNEIFKRDVTSIRSFNHQLYILKQSKIALTSFYDKMKLVGENNCSPFGYKTKNN